VDAPQVVPGESGNQQNCAVDKLTFSHTEVANLCPRLHEPVLLPTRKVEHPLHTNNRQYKSDAIPESCSLSQRKDQEGCGHAISPMVKYHPQRASVVRPSCLFPINRIQGLIPKLQQDHKSDSPPWNLVLKRCIKRDHNRIANYHEREPKNCQDIRSNRPRDLVNYEFPPVVHNPIKSTVSSCFVGKCA
jgi:hypothetical protein